MLVHSADILLAMLWALAVLCVMSPIMMLGRAYQASNIQRYHYRGHHLLEKQYHLKYVRMYGFMASAGFLAVGVYLFLL